MILYDSKGKRGLNLQNVMFFRFDPEKLVLIVRFMEEVIPWEIPMSEPEFKRFLLAVHQKAEIFHALGETE